MPILLSNKTVKTKEDIDNASNTSKTIIKGFLVNFWAEIIIVLLSSSILLYSTKKPPSWRFLLACTEPVEVLGGRDSNL